MNNHGADQKTKGSLIRMVTSSSRFLTVSNTLSSKTVVNSCSMLVNSTVIFKESKFKSFLMSWLNLKF